MKSFQAKQRVPDHVRDQNLNNNGRSSGPYYNVRDYSQQRPHNYLLPKKIISKFNPQKQHQQQQQRYYYPSSNSNPSKLNAEISSSFSCYICNKSFPSSQFLYSHMMRLHPERGMKGVLPPEQVAMMKPVIPSQSQSSNERGMKGVLPPEQAPVMKSVVVSHSQSSNERGMKRVLPPESVILSQSQSLNEGGMKGVLQPPRAPISTMKSVIPSQSLSPSASESSNVTEPDCDPVKLLLSWGKKDRRGRTNNPCSCACASNATVSSLQNPNETMEVTKRIVSSTSGRINTPIASQQNPNKSNSTRTADNEITLIGNKMTKMTMMTSKHKCNTCHKEFDTGQALGGHKSSSACREVIETKVIAPAAHEHAPQVVGSTTKTSMDDDIEEGEITEDGEITDEEGSQRIRHKMLEFDLNELPPED